MCWDFFFLTLEAGKMHCFFLNTHIRVDKAQIILFFRVALMKTNRQSVLNQVQVSCHREIWGGASITTSTSSVLEMLEAFRSSYPYLSPSLFHAGPLALSLKDIFNSALLRIFFFLIVLLWWNRLASGLCPGADKCK